MSLYYPQAQQLYRDAGFANVLPLPAGKKKPVPAGFTGYNWRTPAPEDYARWMVEYRDGNTAIHTGATMVGFDKDCYDGKTGAATMIEAERRFGPLLPTWTSTSRDDGSGIRWYRVPAGTHLVSEIVFPELGLGNVEVVQYYHRYGTVWPSIHPDTGDIYVWRSRMWIVSETIPNPIDFPMLGESWLEGLKKEVPRHRQGGSTARWGSCEWEREQHTRRAQRDARRQTAGGGADTLTGGHASGKVTERLAQAIVDLDDEGNRHDATRDHVLAIARFGEMGEPGTAEALDDLQDAFVAAVTDDGSRSPAEAGYEFTRLVAGAENIIAADPSASAIVNAVWPRRGGGHREDAVTTDGQVGQDKAEENGEKPTPGGRQRPTAEQRAAEAGFWLQRKEFVRIHQFARSRRKNPYAVLIAEIRRAISLVPPRVQLPHNDVGTATSINFFSLNAARSGQGKDGANGVARDGVRFFDHTGTELEDPPSPGIGTGEGLARLFRGYGNNSDQPAENQDRVHLEVNEVGTLESLADRKGGTLVGELLKAFMGQPIGFSNAARATTTYIRAQSYRLCLSIGVQSENAGFFFDREKDGLPQRFFWAPIVNPYALPPKRGAQKVVPALEVTIPEFSTLVPGVPYLIGVPASVREEIAEFHYLVEIDSPDVDPLDGHLMLVRLKLSFGLALLGQRRDITEEDWRIAGQLMDVSNRVRADMRDVVADRHRKKNIGRAHDQADRDAIISEKLTEARQKRVLGAITRKLQRVGVATERELMLACDSSIREDFPTVFDLLLDQRYLVVDGGEGTDKRYRLSAV